MIEELKTLIAVVEHNNFTKAADALNISQPSVSLQIKKLESYFNTTLVQRSVKQKNIYITDSGYMLYEKGKEILKILDDTVLELSDKSSSISGKLRIGSSYTIGEFLLPAFLGKFTKKYPDLELEVLIENTHDICEKVKEYKVDLALVEGTVNSLNLSINHFYKDKMVLATSYDHELSDIPFDPIKLCDQTWISREVGSGTREYLNLFLSNNDIDAKNVIVFGSNYSVKEAVRNNLGITFISSLVIEAAIKNKEISIIETRSSYNRNFSYIVQKGITPSRAVSAFVDELIEYVGKL